MCFPHIFAYGEFSRTNPFACSTAITVKVIVWERWIQFTHLPGCLKPVHVLKV